MENLTKCYCGHTTYCDCGPEQDFKDIELPQQERPETLEEAAERIFKSHSNNTSLSEGYYEHMMDNEDFKEASLHIAKWQIDKQDEFTLGFLHWYNTSQECETYLRRNYPKNITMNGEHYKKVLEINKELLEIFKKERNL